MLTLDETTLFYLSLPSAANGSQLSRKSAIDRWAEDLPPRGVRTASGPSSRASTATMLSRVSSAPGRHTAVSALTKGITITSKLPVVKAEPVADIHDFGGGLSDCDETQGPERDNAVYSPIKGNARKDSSVRTSCANSALH